MLSEDDWSELRIGIAQRLRALDAFVADVYGDARVVAAGGCRKVVEGSPHFVPSMRGAQPSRWIAYAGFDVVRCADGRFRVIEDQVRMASGSPTPWPRETLRDLLPVGPPRMDVSPAFGELALAIREAAPPGVEEPAVVLLCESRAPRVRENTSAWPASCAPAVTLADLDHRDGRLVAWLDGRRAPWTLCISAPLRIASTAPRSGRRCSRRAVAERSAA